MVEGEKGTGGVEIGKGIACGEGGDSCSDCLIDYFFTKASIAVETIYELS